MQIICVSRGSFAKGKELAESLAAKMGCACVSREDLVEAAIIRGIAVNKLEKAMNRPRVFTERLGVEKAQYRAFGTAYLLDRAKRGTLVYHGRVGHLLLPGIPNLLRIRVVADLDERINEAMERLGLDRARARRYAEDVDEEIKRWVKVFYDVDWEVAFHYDVTMNLGQVSVENASSVLCSMAQLPEFKTTPASLKARENLYLASMARVALAESQATRHAEFTVRADDGVVSVTYLPQQIVDPKPIAEILEEVEGVKRIVCTKAQSNILWIQEEFDPASETFQNISRLAQKWDAAVELLRFQAAEEDIVEVIDPGDAESAGRGTPPAPAEELEANGGVNDTLGHLISLGRSAGATSVRASARRLTDSINLAVNYSLIVVGNVFLSKGHASQLRMTRELGGSLHDQLRRPVVMAEELGQQFLFGTRQLIRLVVFWVLAAAIYVAVFTHQVPILQFLHPQNEAGEVSKTARILAAAAVFVFVPVIAYIYGTASRLFLRLLRIE